MKQISKLSSTKIYYNDKYVTYGSVPIQINQEEVNIMETYKTLQQGVKELLGANTNQKKERVAGEKNNKGQELF